MKENIVNKGLKARIIAISYKHNLSHLGSCLTAVDIIDEIYQQKKDNEKFVLSQGHAHLAHAVVMEHLGSIKDAEKNIIEHGIHCERTGGCDVSTGSLGMGLSISVGMALADKSKNVYCLISDGEISEGSIYEALNVAEDQKLTNLFIYLNYNGYGAYRAIKEYKLQFLPYHYLIRKINVNDFPFLKGLDAHYRVMTDGEYQQAMEILK